MTRMELRTHPGYIEAYTKIRNYSSGFEFRVDYSIMPIPKRNAMLILLEDAKDAGLIESIKMDFTWDLQLVGETFRRTERRS